MNNLVTYKSLFKSEFHNTSLCSMSNNLNPENPPVQEVTPNQGINPDAELNAIINQDQKLENMQLVKWKVDTTASNYDVVSSIDSTRTTLQESFPWYADDKGNYLDPDKLLPVNDTLHWLKRYLETYVRNHSQSEISESKLLKLIEPYIKLSEDGNTVVNISCRNIYTLIEEQLKIDSNYFKNLQPISEDLLRAFSSTDNIRSYYSLENFLNYVISKIKNGKEYANAQAELAQTQEQLAVSNMQLAEATAKLSETQEQLAVSNVQLAEATTKWAETQVALEQQIELGKSISPTAAAAKQLSDMTIGELQLTLMNLDWNMIVDNAKVAVDVAPLALKLVTFSLTVKTFMKYVYNRPLPPHIPQKGPLATHEWAVRRKELGLFLLVGAPVSMIVAHIAHIGLKDWIKLEVTLPSLPSTSAKDTVESFSIFLMLKNFSKKVPEPLKIFIGFYFLLFLILKLFGLPGILDIMNNDKYMRWLGVSLCSLAIFYQIINLWLVHKFLSEKIKISRIWPESVINWLEYLEAVSKSKPLLVWFKQSRYKQIVLYLCIMLLYCLLT